MSRSDEPQELAPKVANLVRGARATGAAVATQDQRYDRELLLKGPKRNQVLELREVQRYGTDSFGDADYVCVYGLKPAEWHARGVRLLGRTVVELTRDRLGQRIGRDIAAVARNAPSSGGARVVDLFAGSGNTLYWMLRELPGATGIGFELDDTVFALSSRNLAIVRASIEYRHRDYAAALTDIRLATGQLLVAFVAPPWGDGLSESTGLDLRRTTPPIHEILERIGATFNDNPILYAIQVYERVEPSSLAELTTRFAWSALRVYDFNTPGKNHGLLLGTRGWTS
jgi:hypothetical protein